MESRKSPDLFYHSIPDDTSLGSDPVSELLLREYGAVLVARNGAVPPPTLIFRNEEDAQRFQASVETMTETIGEFAITLQAIAMEALLVAVQDAQADDRSITPRGPDSGARSYAQTVELWQSRVEPALEHWHTAGRLTTEKVDEIRSMTAFEQVREVLKLEKSGMFFSKDLSKTIIYSVAPPGASQHLSMLAVDVKEFDDPRVREILAGNGWHQTVTSDLPHFTFLGLAEGDLPRVGLKRVENAGRSFWVPDIED